MEVAEGDNDETLEPVTKKKRLAKTELYKPPTNEELARLKETETLYQSSLFTMQIDELLSEVQPAEKKRNTLEKVLDSFEEFLEKLPASEQFDLTDQSWLPESIKVPIIQEPYQSKGTFHFEKPSSVTVIGSYPLGTCTKPKTHVDVAIEMPKACLQEKDYLNFRYHRKRALYIAYIAWQIQRSKFMKEVKYSYKDGDHFKPILVLRPSGRIGKTFSLQVHVSLPEAFCKLNRFHPDKNNVRTHWLTGVKTEQTEDMPTPHYNNSIAMDMTINKNRHHLERICEYEGIKQGIVLLKVWIHQRQIDEGCHGFTGFVMSMLVSYLMLIRKVNYLMNGYQVMRNALHFIASTDWTSEGISLCTDNDDPNQPITADFHKYYDVIFVDTSGFVNLCANVTKSTYLQMKHEAELSLQTILSSSAVNSFHTLFMTPVPFQMKFDQIFHISRLSNLKSAVAKFDDDDRLVDFGGNYVTAVLPSIIEVLEKGLGKRIKLLGMCQPDIKEWNVDQRAPHWKDLSHLTFGLLLDNEFASSILDKGPPADTAEAAEFRSFWGERSELRRFQDASIREAVLWQCNTMADRRLICQQVVTHLLKLHAGMPQDSVTYLGGHLDPLLWQPLIQDEKNSAGNKKRRKEETGTGDEENLAVLHAFDSLNKMLRGLDDLPLSIASIQGSSPIFRYAEVIPPSPAHKLNRKSLKIHGYIEGPLPQTPTHWTPALKVICTMEGSGKWPDDLPAIQAIKAAFHIKLANLMRRKHGPVAAATDKYADIVQDGFVFRVMVAYPREVLLLKKLKSPDGLVKVRDTKESKMLDREISALPKLTSALHGIQQECAAYSGTVRLAKRWISSHLLSLYFQEEAIELLVAYLFIKPEPFTPPGSSAVGFLRFLHLLSHYDWDRFPFVVNLNKALTEPDFDEIHQRFKGNRSQLPAMFISTPMYKYSSPWTSPEPSKQILQRVVVLAKESLEKLQEQMARSEKSIDFRQVFRPVLNIYDVIIHLKTKYLPRCIEAVDPVEEILKPKEKKEPYRHITEEVLPVVNFDPLQKYVQELKDSFGELAMFFCDLHGGDFIAVVWKSKAFERRPFKISELDCQIPKIPLASGKEIDTCVDVKAVIEDFQIIGQGLVQSIEIMTEKWNIE
ncbi:nucleolar protein 6-like isoform X2 [Ptychodera flava]